MVPLVGLGGVREYAGTPNTWAVGAKQTGYVPGLAAYAGSDPSTADWRFNLSDHLGSPRQMLGQDKSAKARYDFSPYGELMRSAGMPLTVGYTGHRWDPAIGQYFAPFRYYNPQTARWNMRDPLGLLVGLNFYAYVAQNPANNYDPLGLFDCHGSKPEDKVPDESKPAPKTTPNNESPAKDQVDNAVSTAVNAASTVAQGSLGTGNDLTGPLAGAAQVAPDALRFRINQADKDNFIDNIDGPIPTRAGGNTKPLPQLQREYRKNHPNNSSCPVPPATPTPSNPGPVASPTNNNDDGE